MLNRHMSCGDRCLLWTGIFMSICFGAAMPAFCLLFGGLIDGNGKMDKASGANGVTDSFSGI